MILPSSVVTQVQTLSSGGSYSDIVEVLRIDHRSYDVRLVIHPSLSLLIPWLRASNNADAVSKNIAVVPIGWLTRSSLSGKHIEYLVLNCSQIMSTVVNHDNNVSPWGILIRGALPRDWKFQKSPGCEVSRRQKAEELTKFVNLVAYLG